MRCRRAPRSTRCLRRLPPVALALVLGPLLGFAAAARGQEILPLAEVRAGQRGYGLSVFQGDRPDRFEVEVLGVWKNLRPDTSFILARLSGQGLETSGVIAGMSGSPVYLDGRLAGAVAFAWPFAREPIAGITPIEQMRRLYGAPAGASSPVRGSSAVTLDQLAANDLPQDLLLAGLGLMRSQAADRFGSGLMWTTVGFGEASRQRLAGGLGTVSPAGSSRLAPAVLEPGGSVAGVLIDGDLRMAATGTVTDRVGDSLLAFGHAFLGIGDLSVPMATSEVIAVLPSQLSSFKIANLGSVVGAFELDRAAGIRGRLGAVAPTVPLAISVRGQRRADFELRLARLPTLTPTLAAVSVLGALDAATRAGGAQGLDMRARLDLAEHGELRLEQSFDGDSAGMEAAVYLLAFAGFLTGNPMAEVELAAIEIELEQHPQPRLARLVEAHASRTELRPGDQLELNLDLMAYRGEPFRESVPIQLPTDLPDGRYSLLVGDGVSVDAARLAIERAAPVRFRQALDLLRGLHSRRDLVVLGVFGGQGLAVAGETLPQLPGSLRSIWAAAPSGGAKSLRLAVAQQSERRLAVPVNGLLRVDLEVRRREPVAPGDSPPAAGAPGPTAVSAPPAKTGETG
jgi:hypothetical protein